MQRKTRPYEIGLHERLQNKAHALSYIKAAAADSIEGLLLAVRDFVNATMGMSKVAEASDKNREHLYDMLSEDGNPRLKSFDAVLGALGLRVSVESTSEFDETPEPQLTESGSVSHSPSTKIDNLKLDLLAFPALSANRSNALQFTWASVSEQSSAYSNPAYFLQSGNMLTGVQGMDHRSTPTPMLPPGTSSEITSLITP
jgi:probable addiction module antidote protein